MCPHEKTAVQSQGRSQLFSGATKEGEGTEGVHVDEGEGYHKVK